MSPLAADLLEAAADLLEKDGVCKGQFSKMRNGKFAHCSMGALMVAADRTFDETTYERAVEALNFHVVEYFDEQNIVAFNDRRNRKPATIIKAFRDAAVSEREYSS